MTDIEFINFLWKKLWDLANGEVNFTTSDWDLIVEELTKRKILDGRLPE